MGMMARMRNLAPWFIITVGGLFVLFMVLSDSKITQILGQRSNNVGYIDGEPVTYQEFSQVVETARNNRVQATGQDIPEEQMSLFRDQVWDAYVSQKLVEKKIEEYGIEVSDEEIRDALLGPNPPNVIKQYFIDSTGNFDRERYEQAIFDPQNKQAMLQTEEIVRQQKLQEKLEAYVNSSVVVSEEEIKEKFINDNIKMYADYAYLNGYFVPDSLITITEDDLRDYYNRNLDEYKIEPQRQLKFVLFKEKASKDDTLFIQKNLKAIVDKLQKDTSSFKTYVEIYSEVPYRVDTLSINRVPILASEYFLNAKDGDIIGPVIAPEGYVVYRVKKVLKSKDQFVRASHILIKTDGKNDDAAKKEAYAIYQQLKNGTDFAQLAKDRSDDPGSAVRGGDLGWFGKGQMVKPFEDACFKGKVGKVQKPIKTRFGYHIILVTGKNKKKYAVEKIVNKIKPSATTVDKIYNDASDFAYLADKNDFDEEAKLMNYTVSETRPFKEDAFSVPGLEGNKGIIQWAFNNDLGDISKVFKVELGYTVVKISNVIKAGFKDFEDVKSQVEAKVKALKKRDYVMNVAKEIREKIGDSGNLEIAKEVFPKAVVKSAQGWKPLDLIPTIGKEPAFTQYCLTGEINKVSDPVKGVRGAYLIKVTDRTKFDSTSYQIQHNTIRDQLYQAKRASNYRNWLESIKKEADIVDERYLFYR